MFLSTVMRVAQVVSKPNHIGSVSDSLGRLTAVSECMASNKKIIQGSIYMLWLDNNNNSYITSMALKSSGARARKCNKTKSLIIFKNRGHIRVIIISMRDRRLFKVEKPF